MILETLSNAYWKEDKRTLLRDKVRLRKKQFEEIKRKSLILAQIERWRHA